jgi:hypothetical protein
MGEAFLDLALIVGHQPYKFSIHLTASTSLTNPRYLWVPMRIGKPCISLLLGRRFQNFPEIGQSRLFPEAGLIISLEKKEE